MESPPEPAFDLIESLSPEAESAEVESAEVESAEVESAEPELAEPESAEPDSDETEAPETEAPLALSFGSPPPEPWPAAPKPLHAAAPPQPLRALLPRSLAFTGSPTLYEYLDREGPDVALTRRRLTEVRLPPGDQLFFVEYPDPLNLVAVVGAAMPETPAMLPLWYRIASSCPRADLRIIGDDDLPRLEHLLGDEGQVDFDALDLPMLFILDEDLLLQAQWGPRPQAAEPYLDGWMALHPDFESLAESESYEAQMTLAALTQDLAHQMRIWYNSGLDAEASAELRALLASLREDAGDLQ